MAIPVIGKFIQRNGGTFKLMDSKNVSYDGEENHSVKDRLDALASKVICFVLKDISQGVQSFECQFPYAGTIKTISAIYSGANISDDIKIDIEKANEDDRLLDTWTSILTPDKILVNTTGSVYTLASTAVIAKEVFRINILNSAVNISSLTVNIEIII